MDLKPKSFYIVSTFVSFSFPAAVITNFVSANDYPLLADGSWQLIAFLALALCLLNLFSFLKTEIASLLAASATLFYLENIYIIHFTDVTFLFDKYVLLANWVLLFYLFFSLRTKGWTIVTTVAGTILITSFIGASGANSYLREIQLDELDSNTSLGASVVHIVFDEHASIHGLPSTIPEALLARTVIKEFYEKYGFLLFTDSFSSYFNSRASVSNALRLDAKISAGLPEFEEIDSNSNFSATDIFEQFSQQELKIRIYQSTYMDFCDLGMANLNYCLIYNYMFGSISELDITTFNKSLIILGHLLDGGNQKRLMITRVLKSFRFIPHETRIPLIDYELSGVGPIPTMQPLQQLFDDILLNPTGHAFFGHLLIPHYPYVYTQNCSLRDVSDWRYRTSEFSSVVLSEEDRKLRYRLYAEQIMCLYKILDLNFAKLEQAGLLEKLTFIFHGDHGSRIVSVSPNLGALATKHWQSGFVEDGFATHFAIKAPQVAGGENHEPWMIKDLVWRSYINPTSFSAELRPDSEPYIYLFNDSGSGDEYLQVPIFLKTPQTGTE